MNFKKLPKISEQEKIVFDVNQNLFKSGRLDFMDTIPPNEILNLDEEKIFDFLKKSPTYFKDEIERLYQSDSSRNEYNQATVYVKLVKWFFSFRHRYANIKGIWR